MANTVNFTTPNDYSLQMQDIERQRKLADALAAQAAQPIEQQTAGGWVVPISPWQGAAKLAQGFASGYSQHSANERARKLGESMRTDADQWVSTMPQGTQARPAQITDVGPSQPTEAKPATKQEMLAWALRGAQNPLMQPVAAEIVKKTLTPFDPNQHLAHLDPGKFVPESWAKYVQTGDTTHLRPVASPTALLNNQMARAQLEAKLYMWRNLSPQQRAQLSKEVQEFNLNAKKFGYESGVYVPEMQLPTEPVPTPTLPGAPTLTPPSQQPAPQPSPSPAPIPGPMMDRAGLAKLTDDQLAAGIHDAVVGAQQFPNDPSRKAAYDAFVGAAKARGMNVNVPFPSAQPAPAVPGVPPGLPPKLAAETAAALTKQRGEMEGKREFNMGGINDALNTAEQILKGNGPVVAGVQTKRPLPTSSAVGSGIDTVAGWFGTAPKGAAEADQLRSIGGALVAKMPRMEGPQSDKDVQLYREMAGQLGDSSLPISRRLAALKTVRDLYAKYERQQPQTQGAAPSAAPQTMRFDAQGNMIP